MAGPKFIPIIPKKRIGSTSSQFTAEVRRVMQGVVADGQRTIAEYPAQTLTKSGYRRTNTLKRSWSSEVRQVLDRIEGIVASSGRIAPYNIWVQGPDKTQRPLFANAGWLGVDDLAQLVENDLTLSIRALIRELFR